MTDLKNSYAYDVVEDGAKVYLVFKKFPLPEGVYNQNYTDLLIFTTQQYPNANFDMFWTEESLTLNDGRVPRNAEVIETHLGKRWRRFSYHPYNTRPWNPAQDNVSSYIEYVKQRLRKGD